LKISANTTLKLPVRQACILTIVFAVALLLADVTAASAKSLLDSVLNVVMGGDMLPSKDERMVATQNDDVLHFVIEYDGPIRRSVTVNRIGLCIFEVDNRGPLVADADAYRVDFSQAEFDKVRVVDNRNLFGHQTRVLSIPGAKFCLANGRDYNNPDVGAGSCVDYYRVGPVPNAGYLERMQNDIDRIRQACAAVSFLDGRRTRNTSMQ
jgi:hypothetical protein